MRKKVFLLLIPLVLLVGFYCARAAVGYLSQDASFGAKEEVSEGSKWEFDFFKLTQDSEFAIYYDYRLRGEIISNHITSVGDSAIIVYDNEGDTKQVFSSDTGDEIGKLVYGEGAVTFVSDSDEETIAARYFKDYLYFKDGTVFYCNYSGGNEETKDEYLEAGIDEDFVKASVKEDTIILGEYSGKKIDIDKNQLLGIGQVEYESAEAYITKGLLYVKIDMLVDGWDEVQLTLVFKPVE